ncbi:hypothetical protein I302_109153 [Kwoniella bestiolae CBS 10118]|uniref:RING-type E3 ubiquitin transferase n=1 Tax=Kwoniella bestiolae CBS 10118 TaxID=1296100 RepID=A0A1B9FV63_9TREE|nr:hypothetical protein I302_08299 [Kwoniella bestiolae CBS 10118]OCF22648.1 hypothetical protein I302_08299 [Kwoniella bestiolae CBS 10118]
MISLTPITRLWVLVFSLGLVYSLAVPSTAPAPTHTHHDQDAQSGMFDLTSFDLGSVPLMNLPRTDTNKGWLARWLSMGGEGEVVIHLPPLSHPLNLTLPHRPASFPDLNHLSLPLPLSGFLIPFSKLSLSLDDNTFIPDNSNLACLPPLGLPRLPPHPPAGESYQIVLVERGGCDFATKVRAAQDRGAHAVVVGDSVAHLGESDEEGRKRESLITMFSPEDTDSIFIPSVFVSRASYLALRDLLANGTSSGKQEREGLWIDLSQGSDESGALTSLLSFALLMPSLFLLATVAIHRIRVARQREKDRAPPMIVLSLPERIWTPDIVWEKDDSSSDRSVHSQQSQSRSRSHSPSHSILINKKPTAVDTEVTDESQIASSSSAIPHSPALEHPPPPISPSEVRTPPPVSVSIELPSSPLEGASASASKHKNKRRHRHHVKRQYFSKDECAICMDNFEKGDVVRILPCGHVFHKEECDEWLMKWRKLCPTCRADVTLPPGGAVKGSTLTPVTNPPDHLPGAEIPRQRESSWVGLFRSARERLYGLWGSSSEDGSDEENENTPLIPRSPTGHGRRGSTTSI